METHTQKLTILDIQIACAALRTIIAQTETLIEHKAFSADGLKSAKRALKETKATYKKFDSVLEKADKIENLNNDEVLKNGI